MPLVYEFLGDKYCGSIEEVIREAEKAVSKADKEYEPKTWAILFQLTSSVTGNDYILRPAILSPEGNKELRKFVNRLKKLNARESLDKKV